MTGSVKIVKFGKIISAVLGILFLMRFIFPVPLALLGLLSLGIILCGALGYAKSATPQEKRIAGNFFLIISLVLAIVIGVYLIFLYYAIRNFGHFDL